jgi:hypothetical protein
MSTWVLYTLGDVPHIVEDDGNMFLRVQNLGAAGSIDDAIEVRFRAVSQLFCERPMANGRFVIS